MATEFQKLVWAQLNKIPKGRVTTYGALAASLGKPKSSRAVGSACGANPQLVAVPCHRVVASTGVVGHYAGGAKKKVALLQKEGLEITNGKIVDFEKKLFTF